MPDELSSHIKTLLKYTEMRTNEEMRKLIPYYQQVTVFKEFKMTEGDLLKIIQLMGFCYCKEGEVLYKRGEEADYFYVVLEGKVD